MSDPFAPDWPGSDEVEHTGQQHLIAMAQIDQRAAANSFNHVVAPAKVQNIHADIEPGHRIAAADGRTRTNLFR